VSYSHSHSVFITEPAARYFLNYKFCHNFYRISFSYRCRHLIRTVLHRLSYSQQHFARRLPKWTLVKSCWSAWVSLELMFCKGTRSGKTAKSTQPNNLANSVRSTLKWTVSICVNARVLEWGLMAVSDQLLTLACLSPREKLTVRS